MHYCILKKDSGARYGHRTPSKEERITTKSTRKYLFNTNSTRAHMQKLKCYSFLISHLQTDTTGPSSPEHTTKQRTFSELALEQNSLQILRATQQAYAGLHYEDVKALIAKNGRGFYKSEIPKDKRMSYMRAKMIANQK